VLVLHDGELRSIAIEEVVRKKIRGSVVGFDPDTFEVGYFPITGWYEGPPDRIFDIRLRSGRSVRVTGGHNLFTLDERGELVKVRTLELTRGTRVALPRQIPDPVNVAAEIDLRRWLPESADPHLVVEGPTIAAAFTAEPSVRALLRDNGYRHTDFYARIGALPLGVARQVPGLLDRLTSDDRIRSRGGKNTVPVVIDVDEEIAWLLGIYVAEGYRRAGQVTISNTNRHILDRAQAAFAHLGLPVSRAEGVAVTCTSNVLSLLLGELGTGDDALHKRLPTIAFGWPKHILAAVLEGMLDGDGSRDDVRDSYWSSSAGLVDDTLLLAERLGLRAAAWYRAHRDAYQVGMPKREHKLLCSVPLPNEGAESTSLPKLSRPVEGGLLWDEVVEVRDTGEVETIFDLSVQPDGRHIENFLAGSGGVFVSNTAGFVDAGWDGHLTLELSNVSTLPITLYPGMKIGQISFLQMTTPADNPYGTKSIGSKYKGQRGPTPSRYFENFRE
jgi:dCTP deaminase